jgi:serine/threonine protein kinase
MLSLVKGKEINARYVIHDVLGTGGFASVWKASDKQLNRDVALKRLLKSMPTSPDEDLKKILEEAQKHAQLVHTNIVQVYDVIECEGEHLIVMEYVGGPSLHAILLDLARRNELSPLDRAVAVLRDVLAGLAFAHEKSLIHRDLSPSNILLTPSGIPKIADFGIARILPAMPAQAQPGSPRSYAATGNLKYMSPEQARGEPADFVSDLFMVGIIGYLLLTGRHPFAHPSGLFEIPDLIRDDNYTPEPPRPPSALTTSQQRLFREYSAVVMRLLHRERAGRFPSARAAIDAIEAVTPTVDCPSCGERVPEKYLFCGFCGASVMATPPIAKDLHATSTTALALSADELVEEGFNLSQVRNWDGAISLYQQALAKDPRMQKAYRNLGFALNHAGRYEEAEQVLSKGLELPVASPSHRASMLYQRGFARSNLKKYDGALADLGEMLKLQPGSIRGLYHMARVHLYRGDTAEARRIGLDVLKREPDHAGAIRLLDQLSEDSGSAR